jgi:hypothetical protein
MNTVKFLGLVVIGLAVLEGVILLICEVLGFIFKLGKI